MEGSWKSVSITLLTLFFLNFITAFVGASEDPSRHLCRQDQRDALLELKKEIFSSLQRSDLEHTILGEKNLGVNSLEGEIDSSSSLFRLKNLRTLNLAYNDFNSSIISTQYTTFKELTVFNLSQSSFSGQVPTELVQLTNGLILSSLGNLSRLTNIHLSGNTFGGEIPSSFGRLNQLTSLDVNSNKLSGNFPIALLNLTKLSYLSLSYNQFTGILPPNISSLSSLENFEARQNSFFGTIPSTFFFTIPSLGTIDLADNQLSGALGFVNMSSPPFSNRIRGQVPGWFLSNWTTLFFGKKWSVQLDMDMVYSWTLGPFVISTAKSLSVLDIGDNHFTGSLPDIFKNATNLRSLNLGHNHFVGETSKIFDKLLFSGGQTSFMGYYNINPKDLPGFRSSESLTYPHNDFTGTLLYDFFIYLSAMSSKGDSPKFKYIHISATQCNGFNGNIPSSLGNLTQLESLDNELSGQIPPAPQGPHETVGLCGQRDKEEPSQTEEKEEEEDDDVISWIAAAIGLPPGFIFGRTIGHIVIARKPQWFIMVKKKKKTRRIALV
ncbi:hypothetical protein F2Q68_00011956 [Brassica cretica]|uniref:Leucine-rich repeat-containing N-terminal plant-type domain-containing protein n=1 Tax=Brassica cretica TaxID=69181 RepID=A0A8S9L2P8_BRACR|nr:hypothetical protein F2Q68_00011956 [Brassica cretica]